MTNLLAYLIAVVIVYRKYLIGLVLALVFGLLLLTFDRRSIEVVKEHKADPALIVVTSELSVGQVYETLAALDATMEIMGYVSVGRFGDSWPAEVTEILDGNDGIRFTRQNGTVHNYRGFDGYRMKAVRLRGKRRKENFLVYRFATKH